MKILKLSEDAQLGGGEQTELKLATPHKHYDFSATSKATDEIPKWIEDSLQHTSKVVDVSKFEGIWP